MKQTKTARHDNKILRRTGARHATIPQKRFHTFMRTLSTFSFALIALAAAIFAIQAFDIRIDIGGMPIFTHTGELIGPVQTLNFADQINTYLQTCTPDQEGMCEVPLDVRTNSPIRLEGLQIYYTMPDQNDPQDNTTLGNQTTNNQTQNNQTKDNQTQTNTTRENKAPVASFSLSPENGTAPLTVQFDASKSTDPDGTIEDYEWIIEGLGSIHGRETGYTFTTPGTFMVTLKVTDDKGARAQTSTMITMHAKPNLPPVAVINTSKNSGRAPLLVDFDAGQSLDNDGRVEVFAWNFGDGESATTQRVTHNFTKPGTYKVYLGVLDNQNASGIAFAEIVVNENQQPRVVSISQTSFRRGSPLSFTVVGDDPDNDELSFRLITHQRRVDQVINHQTKEGRFVSAFEWGDGTFTTLGRPVPIPPRMCFTESMTVYVSDGTSETNRPFVLRIC